MFLYILSCISYKNKNESYMKSDANQINAQCCVTNRWMVGLQPAC